VGERRVVLPAFSPWAAGTPWVSDPAGNETLWAIAPTRIFSVNRAAPFPNFSTS
jgi:metallophosphoesterase superfamily enzyme